MDTFRIGVGTAICFLGASKGLPLPELLAIAGLDPTRAANPDEHLSIDAGLAVFRRIEAACPDRALGLDLVEMTPREAFGLVEMAAWAAPTINEAAQVYARFVGLTSTAVRAWVERSGADSEWIVEHHPDVEAMAHPIDVALGLARRNLKEAGAELVRVDLKHAPRGPAARYAEFFGCPVRFEQARSRLVLDNVSLERAPARANPELNRSLLQQLAVLAPDDEAEELSAQVRKHAFHSNYEVTRLAQRLGVSARTLQRRATAAGTTLRALLEEVRMEQAKSLLADRTLGIEDVAFLVSYADLRGFTRAFKRAEGTTPAVFRQRLSA